MEVSDSSREIVMVVEILKFNKLILKRRLRSKFSRYVIQCGFATIALACILLLADEILGTAIIVAIGSTVFTIFVVPVSLASSPRFVLGGHVIGILVSGIFVLGIAILGLDFSDNSSKISFDLIAAMAVGLGIFLMVVMNAPHPPAAGTILGLLANGWDISAVLFVVISSISLILIRLLFGHRLVNLI